MDSDAIAVGERVYAIGNAKGDGISVSSGVVSVDKEYIDRRIVDNVLHDCNRKIGRNRISHSFLREDVPVSVELTFDEDSKFTVYS